MSHAFRKKYALRTLDSEKVGERVEELNSVDRAPARFSEPPCSTTHRWSSLFFGPPSSTTDRSSQCACPSQASDAATQRPLRHVNSPGAEQLLYADTHILAPFASRRLTSLGHEHSTLPSADGVHTCEQPPFSLSHGFAPEIHRNTHTLRK